MRVPAADDALWTLKLPFEIFQLEICRQALNSSHLRGSFSRHQALELLDDDDPSGEASLVPFRTQGTSRQHDLWALDKAMSTALEAVVPSWIAELSLPSTSPLGFYLQGFASPLYRKILFSMANNCAGLRASVGPQIIRFLSKETHETLYQLIFSIPGPSGQAIVQNIFKCAIEIGDARIVELLLRNKAAEIGINQLYCFNFDAHYISTPIEQAVLLRHTQVVEILLHYDADVNRTYPEYTWSRNGALECAFQDHLPGYRQARCQDKYSDDLPDPQLFEMLIDADGELSTPTLEKLIRSPHNSLATLVISKHITRDLNEWSDCGVFQRAFVHLEDSFLVKLLSSMLQLGAKLDQFYSCGLDGLYSGTVIDIMAKTGRLGLIRVLHEHTVLFTDDTLACTISSGNEDLIRFLLFDLHADPFRVGPLGITPFEAAIRHQKPWLVEFFIDHGVMNQMTNRTYCLSVLEAVSDARNNELLLKFVKMIEVMDPRVLEKALCIAIKNGLDALALQLIDAGVETKCYDGTPLVEAVKCRNKFLIFALLDADAVLIDASMRKSAYTDEVWQLAVEWGDRTIIHAFIEAGADVNVSPSDEEYFEAPLNTAIRQYDFELLEIFLEAGANINCNHSLLSGDTALCNAVEAADINMVKRLLDYGADPHDSRALKKASKLEDDDILDRILESHNKRYPRGRKAFGSEVLHKAVRHMSLRSMERTIKLLRKNADCNFLVPFRGECLSACGRAISCGNHKFVELFLREGQSDPNGVVQELAGHGSCLTRVSYGQRVTALLAAVNGRSISTIRLLIKHGANVNLPSRRGIKRTPLQAAAEIGSMEIVQLFLDHGADVNGAPAQRGGGTALQYAAAGGYAALVCKLLSHGAQVDSPGSKVDGMTALEAAANNGRLDTVQILLNAGAASTQETRKQITNAVALANDQGHLAVSRLLEVNACASSMSGVLPDDSDVDFSDEMNGHETINHTNDPNDGSGAMHFEEAFQGDEPMMDENDSLPPVQSHQPWPDLGDWVDRFPNSAVFERPDS